MLSHLLTLGPTPVTSATFFQANSKKQKNLVRTRLEVDSKAKFDEVAKPLPYGAGDGIWRGRN